MNTIIRSVGIVLFAIIITTAAVSIVLEIGIINVTQAQEEGQQSPFISPLIPFAPPPPPTPSPPSPPGSLNTTISPEIKTKMCDPNNPKLAFVNSTESEVCGLPKSVRNDTTTTPITPPSSPRPITPDDRSQLP
jgi:hypothetical protein